MPKLVDIGANLTHASFDHDLESVIARARDVGVERMVVTGADPRHSHAARALAANHPGILYATAGVHPHHAAEFSERTRDDLSALLDTPEVVAAGECGLDYFRDFAPRPAQRHAFEAQVALAVEQRKPLFVHEREAHDDLLTVLDGFGTSLPPLVVHCFTGTAAELDAYLERGFHIGITGWICDERRGRHLPALVARIPAGLLMLETDAPYLLPRDLIPRPRTRRNEPAMLVHVAHAVARAREEPMEETAAHTTATALAFFRLATGPHPLQ